MSFRWNCWWNATCKELFIGWINVMRLQKKATEFFLSTWFLYPQTKLVSGMQQNVQCVWGVGKSISECFFLEYVDCLYVVIYMLKDISVVFHVQNGLTRWLVYESNVSINSREWHLRCTEQRLHFRIKAKESDFRGCCWKSAKQRARWTKAWWNCVY